MVTIPLGLNAYKRVAAAAPEIRLVNRFMEVMPQNLREHVTLLGRPATAQLATFGNGNVRGTYFKEGLFNSDLFVVSGDTLYRYNTAGDTTTITGTIYGDGTSNPAFGWMKGIGYEYLFIADSLQLQYYNGGTQAAGTLTLSGGSITSQAIEIGGVYYGWGTDVEIGPPDGTASHPWLALVGGSDEDSLANMAALINYTGQPGVTFSAGVPGPSTTVTVTSDATTLTATALVNTTAGNAISTTVASGAHLAWGATTLAGGGVHELQFVQWPETVGAKSLTSLSGYVLASVADSQKFYWLNPGEVTIDPLDFAEKESNPDAIVEMLTVGDQAIILGEGSTENWYATGSLDAPFAPVEGRVYARGCVEGTSAKVGDDVILVGNDGVVYAIGYSFGTAAEFGVHRISTHGIEERIRIQLRSETGVPP